MVKINVYKQIHTNTKTLCFALNVDVCYSGERFSLAVLAEANWTQVPVVVIHAGKRDCSLRKSEELPTHGNLLSQTSLSFLSNTWLDRAPGLHHFYKKRFYLLDPGL